MTIQQDTTGISTAYDSIWAVAEVPVQERTGIERVALAEDKLFVVLAVVLLIWFGIVFLLLRTDRKIERLERKVDAGITQRVDH
jgi:hypothetical protein